MDIEVQKIIENYKRERGAVPTYVELLAELKPDVLKDFRNLSTKIYGAGSVPRKYKELIAMVACFARLYPGGEAHMKLAISNGATKEEVFEVMLQLIALSGIPAFSTAVRAFKNLKVE